MGGDLVSWGSLPDLIRVTAVEVLTEKQLVAWKLELAGLSIRAIGRHLEVARQTAADRLEAAHRELRRGGVRQDASGRWFIHETTEVG